jgi:hypothetical protein
MPALLLVLRIGRIVLPLPWFILWLILLPFVPLAWLTGLIGSLFSDRDVFRFLMAAPWVYWMLIALHGTEVRIESQRENILVKFI